MEVGWKYVRVLVRLGVASNKGDVELEYRRLDGSSRQGVERVLGEGSQHATDITRRDKRKFWKANVAEMAASPPLRYRRRPKN